MMTDSNGFGAKLKEQTVCVRLSISRCGESRSFSREQNEITAEQFNAKVSRVKGRRQVVDSRNEKWSAVKSMLTVVDKYFKSRTVAIPGEDGRRLLRKSFVSEFDETMGTLHGQLQSAKEELRLAEHEIREASRQDLADLWDDNLLPPNMADEFDFSWAYVEEAVPNYMAELHPELFKREQERIAALFDVAAQEATRQLTEELHKLIASMVERLTTSPGEKAKTFRSSLVGNLTEFFDKFKLLNVGNSAELEAAVEQCKATLTADGQQLTAEKLRKDVQVRQAVASDMSALAEKLATMVVERPKRRVRFTEKKEVE